MPFHSLEPTQMLSKMFLSITGYANSHSNPIITFPGPYLSLAADAIQNIMAKGELASSFPF